MAVARLVRSVVTTDSLIDTVPFVPALLLSEKEIVPSEVGAGNLILVIADASIPKLLALVFINSET